MTVKFPELRPLNVKLPFASAVVVLDAAPLNVTVVPLPMDDGLIVPEMLNDPDVDTVMPTPGVSIFPESSTERLRIV